MKLLNLLLESKDKKETFETFADTREAGAEKIADNAKKKGGLALLTWHHFKVKLPYYKKAAAGKFDLDKAKAEVIIIEVNSLPGMTPATCIFHQAALQHYKPLVFIDHILQFGMQHKKINSGMIWRMREPGASPSSQFTELTTARPPRP